MSVYGFKDSTGAIYNGLALLYVAAGYLLGLAALLHGGVLVSVVATLWLGHAMIIAAYLLHECGHNTIFRKNIHNARLGSLLTWVTGSCYGTYEDIRVKHFRHHIDSADVMWFESRKFFNTHPRFARLVQLLEWFYIPAHDLVMHFIMVFCSYIIPARRSQRLRNTVVIVVRGALFAALAWFFPWAALGYVIAYLLMMTVLRFMDALQHDYGGVPVLFEDVVMPHRGDRIFEQAHTFSNPLSLRHDWLNLLVLNFGYHNAHHAQPITPWFRLPALHRQLNGESTERLILFGASWKSFHRYRLSRVVGESTSEEGENYLELACRGDVSGGNAVSFLTSF
ncbi:MAG: fatty acid desaturase [Proteobacteria bacterium]|nr:fatty acid desaturase [Pseudomonadota bacterium]